MLTCEADDITLCKRRQLRRQRRTLRSRKYRRQWFVKELAKFGLPKPVRPFQDPISLRLRATNGEAFTPKSFTPPLPHLLKRRGYSKVPWAAAQNAKLENRSEGDLKKEVEAPPRYGRYGM